MKEQFFSALAAIAPLHNHTIDDISNCLMPIHVDKNTLLVREGELSNKMYFIIKGAARAYYFHQDKEYTDWFMFENMFMCSLLSFFGGMPSAQFIETLEPSDMLVLTKEQIDGLCEKHHDMQTLNSRILTYGLISLQQNVIDQRFKTAQERYVILLKTFPQIIQRIPLKHIASYLGVTQETLSRIRSSAII
jgi:CRP-like cAMP-binding protein